MTDFSAAEHPNLTFIPSIFHLLVPSIDLPPH